MFRNLAHMSPALHSTASHIACSSKKHSARGFMGVTTNGKTAWDESMLSALALTQVIPKGAPAICGPAFQPEGPQAAVS
jgi:hypothetical protein